MIFSDLIWDMISRGRRSAPRRYREFVESSLKEKPRSPFEQVYAGVILGGRPFIKGVLQQLKVQNLRKVEISHRRALTSTLSDMDEIVRLLCVHFKVPKERVLSSYPYKGIWDLSFEEAHPMFERGDRQILWWAHLLWGRQDWDEAQREDERR